MNQEVEDDGSGRYQPSRLKTKAMHRLGSMIKQLNLDQDSPFQAELIMQVLSTPDSQRDSNMKDALADWMDSIDFFSELKETNGYAYCRKFYSNMTVDSYRQGKLLIKTGDDSDFFYIILSGAVMVLYPRRKVDMEIDCKNVDSSEVMKLSVRDRIWKRIENHTHFRGVPLQSIEHYYKYFNDYGVPVVSVENVLEKGRAFGELGILYKTKRMADIVCQYDCLIAKVSKYRYLQIVGEESQKKFAKTLEFLTYHFYSNMSRMMRFDTHRYLYLFYEMEWKVNSIIFEIDSPLQGLFLIREGCVVFKSHELRYAYPEKIGIQRLGIFRSSKKRKLVAFKELGVGECFGLEPYVRSEKPVGLRYNYQAMTTTKSKLLYCSISQLTEIMKIDKQLEKQVMLKFSMREKLNPIRYAPSASTRLQEYWSVLRNNKPPYYRINPILLQKPETIRSPKIQSMHDKADDKENEKNMLLYSSSVVPITHRLGKCRSTAYPSRKCMSRALELRITEDIANSLERKLSQWKKRKGESAEYHKVMERKIERRNVYTRMKHIRIV